MAAAQRAAVTPVAAKRAEVSVLVENT